MRLAKLIPLVAAGILLAAPAHSQVLTWWCLWPVCSGAGGLPGDIQSVYDCDTGECNDIGSLTDSVLDFTRAGDADSQNVELRIPISTTCETAIDLKPGALCAGSDATSDEVYIGRPGTLYDFEDYQDISGDVRGVYDCFEYDHHTGAAPEIDACKHLRVPDGGYLNFRDLPDGDYWGNAVMTLDDNVEGLHLPGTAGSCDDWHSSEANGQVCWDRSNFELWVGTGSTSVNVGAQDDVTWADWEAATADSDGYWVYGLDNDMTGSIVSAGPQVTTKTTITTSVAHGLTNGEIVKITSTSPLVYDGVYAISNKTDTTFRITHSWMGPSGSITSFADGTPDAYVTVTASSHGIPDGSTVVIAGGTIYDGTHTNIVYIDANTFDITHSEDGPDTGGTFTTTLTPITGTWTHADPDYYNVAYNLTNEDIVRYYAEWASMPGGLGVLGYIWEGGVEEVYLSERAHVYQGSGDTRVDYKWNFDHADGPTASMSNNGGCETTNDCWREWCVAGASTETCMIKMVSDDAGAVETQIGNPGTSYVTIDEQGHASAAGNGAIFATNMPYGTAPFMNTAGEVAVDLTDLQIHFFYGTTQVIPTRRHQCVKVSVGSSTSDEFVWVNDDEVNIIRAWCRLDGTNGSPSGEPTFYLSDGVGGTDMTFAKAITTITGTGGTKTVNYTALSSSQVLTAGQLVDIAGTDNGYYDGAHFISNVTTTSFDITAINIGDDANGTWTVGKVVCEKTADTPVLAWLGYGQPNAGGNNHLNAMEGVVVDGLTGAGTTDPADVVLCFEYSTFKE